MTRRIQGLLFDKDGTLIDYWKTWIPINYEITAYAARGERAVQERMLRRGGHDPATDRVEPGTILAGGPLQTIVDMLVAEAGPEGPKDIYAATARMFSEGGARNATLIAGTRETLEALAARGYRMGIATNDTAAGLAASLGKFDILPRFVFTCGCDSGFGGKPGPGMVQAFCKATGLAAAEVAVIGDSTHDLEMGRNAQVGLNVAVLTGTSERRHLAPHADIVLDSIADLPRYLAGMGT